MHEQPRHVRVAAPYVSSVTDPVRFSEGEPVGVGRRDQQWTSYVWGTDEAGRSGWVPDAYLKKTGPDEAVALRDYDATELTVARGEQLEVLDEEGGWLLCRPAAGLTGWVPSDHLEARA
jgi:uncharacterized protein YgiM (DUF1202 family)